VQCCAVNIYITTPYILSQARPYLIWIKRHTAYVQHTAYRTQQRQFHKTYGITNTRRRAYGIQHTAYGLQTNCKQYTAHLAFGIWHMAHGRRHTYSLFAYTICGQLKTAAHDLRHVAYNIWHTAYSLCSCAGVIPSTL